MNILKKISGFLYKDPVAGKAGSGVSAPDPGAGMDRAPLSTSMNCYRKMLFSNNRAIEIITDMNNRSNGDSTVDMNFTKKAYAELRVSLHECISYFNVLTRNRYFHLYYVLDTIDRKIRKKLDESVYTGVRQDVHSYTGQGANMDDNNEQAKNINVLKYIAPLNLVDPMLDDFTPEACNTIHDVLRFIHAKSAAELAGPWENFTA